MSQLRTLIGDIIFEHNTRYSRLFDILLLIVILMSVLLVMLESVDSVRFAYGNTLRTLEWVFTFIFTIEYLIRIWVSYNRPKYIRSFFGIVDLLAILPSYLSLFFVGFQYGIVIRSLRLLRVFRILKLVQFVDGASVLGRAVIASRARITVFVFTVLTIVTILGSIMFLVEGPENGFDNIPESIYWAIVTITTVGYGDIAPSTPLGEFLAAMVMILGYGLIAVPTGIVSVEISRADASDASVNVKGGQKKEEERRCENCMRPGHDDDAVFCKYCAHHIDTGHHIDHQH